MANCPFCGGHRTEVAVVWKRHRVHCLSCGAYGPQTPMTLDDDNPASKSDAQRLWDARDHDDQEKP